MFFFGGGFWARRSSAFLLWPDGSYSFRFWVAPGPRVFFFWSFVSPGPGRLIWLKEVSVYWVKPL